MAENNSLTELVRVVYKWRKTILIVTIAALIGSIVIALLLPNYYKSSTIFYAYNLNALDPKTIISEEISDVFGDNSDIERMIQIGNSSGLANHIIQKFSLYKRYDIDTVDNTLKDFEVVQEFEDNFEILKNENGAVEINVLDKDPAIAAKMANSILRYIDEANRQSVIKNNTQIYENLKVKLNETYQELNMVSQSIKNIEKEKQESTLTTKSMIESGKINNVDLGVAEKLAEAAVLKGKYEQIGALLKSNFSTVFVIEPASPAVKKAKPVRWLIVVASTFLAFVLTVTAILMVEFYRNNIRALLQ